MPDPLPSVKAKGVPENPLPDAPEFRGIGPFPQNNFRDGALFETLPFQIGTFLRKPR